MTCVPLWSRALLNGVITGVVLSVEDGQLKLKIPGVCGARRLVQHRPAEELGESDKTLSVLLSFDAESLSDEVKFECVSFPMRAFVPNPLWCFRCQAYGHVAAMCGREIPRCEKRAGGHDTKECVVSVEKVVGVNCRDTHGAGDQRCPVRERQAVLYAEESPRTATQLDPTKS